MDDLKHLLHLVGSLSQHERTCDVRAISLDLASAVHKDDRAFTDHLWRNRAMREGGKLPDLYIGTAFEAELAVSHFYQVLDILLCHSRLQLAVGRLIR